MLCLIGTAVKYDVVFTESLRERKAGMNGPKERGGENLSGRRCRR